MKATSPSSCMHSGIYGFTVLACIWAINKEIRALIELARPYVLMDMPTILKWEATLVFLSCMESLTWIPLFFYILKRQRCPTQLEKLKLLLFPFLQLPSPCLLPSIYSQQTGNNSAEQILLQMELFVTGQDSMHHWAQYLKSRSTNCVVTSLSFKKVTGFKIPYPHPGCRAPFCYSNPLLKNQFKYWLSDGCQLHRANRPLSSESLSIRGAGAVPPLIHATGPLIYIQGTRRIDSSGGFFF